MQTKYKIGDKVIGINYYDKDGDKDGKFYVGTIKCININTGVISYNLCDYRDMWFSEKNTFKITDIEDIMKRFSEILNNDENK